MSIIQRLMRRNLRSGMKRALLFVLIFFGVYPVWRNSEFHIAGPDTAFCQNASHILMRYLEKKDGTKYYYLPVSHNCGCAVAQYSNTGEFVQFHYATKEFYKITPEFQAFIDSAGMDNPYFPLVKMKSPQVAKKKEPEKKEPEKKEGGLEWFGILLLFHSWCYRYSKKLFGTWMLWPNGPLIFRNFAAQLQTGLSLCRKAERKVRTAQSNVPVKRRVCS